MNRAPHHDHAHLWRWTFAGFAPLLAPTAWFFSLLVSYMLVPHVCVSGAPHLLPLLLLCALVLVASAGGVSWRAWKAAGHEWPDEAGGVMPRSRFLAVLSMLSCSLFFLVILAQGIPTLLLSPCQP